MAKKVSGGPTDRLLRRKEIVAHPLEPRRKCHGTLFCPRGYNAAVVLHNEVQVRMACGDRMHYLALAAADVDDGAASQSVEGVDVDTGSMGS
jgi:hypothetical protein